MPEWEVPLADVRILEEDIACVVRTYRSGWLSMGPETDELERAFAQYTGSSDAIAVANGTAALHLQCMSAGLGPGDEVIVPSLTFVATANAIAYTGARPVFADIAGLDAPWLSADACQAEIGSRTAAIVAMHYGGHHGEIEQIEALAGKAACCYSRMPLMRLGRDWMAVISAASGRQARSACSPTRILPWAKAGWYHR